MNNNMRRLFFFGSVIAIVLSLSSCNRGGNGELVGVGDRGKYFEPVPFGMTMVPRGSFTMGPSDQDIQHSTTPSRTVSVDAFWMDETEITNNEYRQFVYWVRDSIARTMLGQQFDEFLNTEDRDGNPKLVVGDFCFIHPERIHRNSSRGSG